MLQSQTNGLNAGITATWHDIPASTATDQMTFSLDAAKPTIFYRLRLP
jgi:hypothetical protein